MNFNHHDNTEKVKPFGFWTMLGGLQGKLLQQKDSAIFSKQGNGSLTEGILLSISSS
jgi:hypothetical protein